MLQADIAIVGGGMVGACAALGLAQAGFSVVVLDTTEPAPYAVEPLHRLRVSAITPVSANIFQALGVWEQILALRACAFSRMVVWEQFGRDQLTFDAAQIQTAELGHIVENDLIQQVLWQALQQQDNVSLRVPCRFTSIDWQADQAMLSLDDGQQLSVKLVLGADGGRSATRAAANIGTISWSYDQHCMVGSVYTEKPHENACWQRFTAAGPVAFLALADGGSSLAWYNTPERSRQLLEMDDQAFATELEQASEGRLGKITRVASRAAFPVQLLHAKDYVQPRLALMGDSAHVIHPLAGQGVNLGIADAATLCDVLTEAKKSGKDIGQYHVLRRYERWRKADNLPVMGFIDACHKVFTNNDPVLGPMRNIGLNMANRIQPAKNRLMQQMVGQVGELPTLAQQNQ